MSGKGFFSGTTGFLTTFVVFNEFEAVVAVSGKLEMTNGLLVATDSTVDAGAGVLMLAL